MCERPVITCGSCLLQRRQQGAAFTPDAMDAYLPRVVATCREYLDLWAAQDHISLVPAVRALAPLRATRYLFAVFALSRGRCM